MLTVKMGKDILVTEKMDGNLIHLDQFVLNSWPSNKYDDLRRQVCVTLCVYNEFLLRTILEAVSGLH